MGGHVGCVGRGAVGRPVTVDWVFSSRRGVPASVLFGVYRLWHSDHLLYVGKGSNFGRDRLEDHRGKWWGGLISGMSWMPVGLDEGEALRVEAGVIRGERPWFNVLENEGFGRVAKAAVWAEFGGAVGVIV